jgi:hypothetical protein
MAEKSGASQEEVKELTKQFFVTLRAYVARLGKQDEDRSPKSFKQVEDLLQSGETWSDAYQIEQLLVDMFGEHHLEVELQSRLLECESNLRPGLAAHYVKLAATLKEPAERRALLARLVNDLQWRYTVSEVKRAYSKDITRTTGLIFILGIGAFAAAVFGIALGGKALSTAGWEAAYLLLAGLAGAWGAGFSMLASLKSRMDAADLNDLKLMKSGWILWSRPLIGVGAACILYFFLVSGLLGGAAFPTPKPETKQVATSQNPSATTTSQSAAVQDGGGSAAPPAIGGRFTSEGLALLVVWCFIAGFSERLVPALLAKTEGRVVGPPRPDPDRFRPDSGTPNRDAPDTTAAAKPESPPAAAAPPGQGTETQKPS